MKHWFPQFRNPSDLDIICKEGTSTREKEFMWVDSFQWILDNNIDDTFIDKDFLYTLKCSHFGWAIKWEKHRSDIIFLQKQGAVLYEDLYKALVKDWTKVHGKAWASLADKTPDMFFKDAVKRKYNHDAIHEIIAVKDEPIYYKTLENRGSVKCLENKFNELTHEDQILMVKEELWVTALERYLIPSNYTCGNKKAYMDSLKKLTTTMSSSWFKQFIIKNFSEIYNCNDTSYIQVFREFEKQNEITLATTMSSH